MGAEYRERCRRVIEIAAEVEAEGRPPTAEDIAERAGWSVEYTLFIVHRLADHGVLSIIPSSFEDRFAIEDEDLLETAPDPDDEPTIGDAHAEQKKKVEEHVGQIGQRFSSGYVDPEKSRLFDDVKARLGGTAPARANPLDGAPPSPKPAADPAKNDLFAQLSTQLSGKSEKKENPLDALLRKKDG